MRAKKLLESVIGAGESRNRVAVPQARPIAVGHLLEVGHHGREERGAAVLAGRHGAEQRPHVTFNTVTIELFGSGQYRSDALYSGRGGSPHRPQRSSVRSALLEEALESLQGLGEAPLFSTRSSAPAMALRRSPFNMVISLRGA